MNIFKILKYYIINIIENNFLLLLYNHITKKSFRYFYFSITMKNLSKNKNFDNFRRNRILIDMVENVNKDLEYNLIEVLDVNKKSLSQIGEKIIISKELQDQVLFEIGITNNFVLKSFKGAKQGLDVSGQLKFFRFNFTLDQLSKSKWI